MYAVISPSEEQGRWSDGAARITVAADHGQTRLKDLYQSDPCRVLFPRPAEGAAFEGVVVTTSGGIVGGDRIAVDITAEDGSTATITTQAAEKIYRSAGPESHITVQITVGENATLEWMPQGTILFDGARLRRMTSINAMPGSRLLCGECIVFGRRARGEKFTTGFLHDGWRLTENDRLIWADALHRARMRGTGSAAFATCSTKQRAVIALRRSRDLKIFY
jgi:urease accessory protein